MKAQNMTIDINRLDVEKLEQLQAMFYEMGCMDEVAQINNRIAYVNGWMTDSKNKEYFEKYCT
ncbi:MAG: hypothetical protein MR945_09055 [Agathobacter sp.]|nr:hypothetical protein [Agathobacter sp.]